MSSVQEIRRRVKWVKEIAQITNAIQRVASSKISKAQKRVQQSQPYADQLCSLVSRLAYTLRHEKVENGSLWQQRPIDNIGVILVTPDRSLCGALPSIINRLAMATVREEQKRLEQQGSTPGIRFIAVGRRGRDFLRRNHEHILAEFIDYGDWPSFNDAARIAHVAVDAFLKKQIDLAFVVYAKNIDAMQQRPVALQLLPIQPPVEEKSKGRKTAYIYEGDALNICEALFTRYVETQVYQALLETIASQLVAQIVAMKNATHRANEMVQDLTLAMNKARQENITMQILDMINSANLTEESM
jgi:F-type H+-transporting ATPase subunit gamma